MKENIKDKLKTETIGVPSIKALSQEDKKAFALAILSCAIDYYRFIFQEAWQRNRVQFWRIRRSEEKREFVLLASIPNCLCSYEFEWYS